jgi:hypothetical protein
MLQICASRDDTGSRQEPDQDARDYDDMPKASKPVSPMSAEQAALLRKLAFDAYEPEAFKPNLTKVEAERRIDVLQAKMKLMSEPPHTQ